MLIKLPINHQPKALVTGDERYVEWAILQLGYILSEIAKGPNVDHRIEQRMEGYKNSLRRRKVSKHGKNAEEYKGK